MIDSRAPARYSSFALLITAVPRAGVVEGNMEEKGNVEKSVGVFAIYEAIALTSSLDLER